MTGPEDPGGPPGVLRPFGDGTWEPMQPSGFAKEKTPNPQAPVGLPGALRGSRVLYPQPPPRGLCRGRRSPRSS